jgi:hypothetical protein
MLIGRGMLLLTMMCSLRVVRTRVERSMLGIRCCLLLVLVGRVLVRMVEGMRRCSRVVVAEGMNEKLRLLRLSSSRVAMVGTIVHRLHRRRVMRVVGLGIRLRGSLGGS